MKKEDKKDIARSIRWEGFDSSMDGAEWLDVKDDEFLKFYHEYIEARYKLQRYLISNGIDVHIGDDDVDY